MTSFFRAIISSIIIFNSFAACGQTGKLFGKVLNRFDNEPIPFANVQLNDSVGTTTNVEGLFMFYSLPPDSYSLKVSSVGLGDTIIQAVLIKENTTSEVSLTLPPFCIYEKDGKSKSCPICEKKDQVIPIIYGLPIGEYDENNYHLAGCAITHCDPKWYCKRDMKKFGFAERNLD